MLTKSKRPSVLHCALTRRRPSCSTSRLTSLMRCGLFLTVCTPSGVSVASMRYVGMAPPSMRAWACAPVVSRSPRQRARTARPIRYLRRRDAADCAIVARSWPRSSRRRRRAGALAATLDDRHALLPGDPGGRRQRHRLRAARATSRSRATARSFGSRHDRRQRRVRSKFETPELPAATCASGSTSSARPTRTEHRRDDATARRRSSPSFRPRHAATRRR